MLRSLVLKMISGFVDANASGTQAALKSEDFVTRESEIANLVLPLAISTNFTYISTTLMPTRRFLERPA